MQRMGRSGMATASSVPGGLFGAPSDIQNRSRLDGHAGGRANSSSVTGGIFGTDSAVKAPVHTKSVAPAVWDGAAGGRANAGNYGVGGGYNKSSQSVWQGAAGGKATNDRPSNDHFRGGTVGRDRYSSGMPAAQWDGGGALPRGIGTPVAAPQASGWEGGGILPRGAMPSARAAHNPNFLDELEAAERRDDEEAAMVQALRDQNLDQPASEEEAIMAAAEQLAEEMGLDEYAQQELEEKLLAQHRAKKQQQPSRQVSYATTPNSGQQQQIPPMHTGGSIHSTGWKPSSRVLAPPGGGSSIVFG